MKGKRKGNKSCKTGSVGTRLDTDALVWYIWAVTRLAACRRAWLDLVEEGELWRWAHSRPPIARCRKALKTLDDYDHADEAASVLGLRRDLSRMLCAASR